MITDKFLVPLPGRADYFGRVPANNAEIRECTANITEGSYNAAFSNNRPGHDHRMGADEGIGTNTDRACYVTGMLLMVDILAAIYPH